MEEKDQAPKEETPKNAAKETDVEKAQASEMEYLKRSNAELNQQVTSLRELASKNKSEIKKLKDKLDKLYAVLSSE
jgi:cell division protein FtsB